MAKIILSVLAVLSVLHGGQTQSVYTNCQNARDVAITWDDGPHPSNTPQLLNVFRELGVKVTFFVSGLYQSNTNLWKQAIVAANNEGHQIGSHTWSHPDLATLPAAQVRNELRQVADLIFEAIGRNVTVFRPPYGSYNAQLLQIAQTEFGYRVVNWNIDTQDYNHQNANQALQEYQRAVQSGQHQSYISLQHDWTGAAVALARSAVQYCQQQGLRVVTVAQCIGVPMFQ